jgi:hypothetical protein
MAWALCNMEQQSRSNTTNATNSTNHQATHKTSSIKPAHLWGLLDLNPGQPSHSLSPFSTASVADSVESAEYTETNSKGIDSMEQEAPPIDKDASGDPGMNDTESEDEGEEISTGGVLSVPVNQVCLFSFFENTTFRFLKFEKTSFGHVKFRHMTKRRLFEKNI